MSSARGGVEVLHMTSELAFRRLRWVYVGFGVAMLVYLQIALRWHLGDRSGLVEAPGALVWGMRAALALLSVAALATTQILARSSGGHGNGTTRQPMIGLFFGELSPDSERRVTLALVRGAFAHAIAVYGLLLSMVGGGLWDMATFGVASLVALAWYFPRCTPWNSPEPPHP